MIDFVLVSPQLIDVLDASIDRTMFTSDGQLVNCNQIDSQGLCTGTNYRAKDLKMYSDHWGVWARLVFRKG